MAREILFDPTNPEHRKHFELGHVVLMQTRIALNDGENRRLGGLQDAWESAGVMVPDEKVVDDRDFSSFRYVLPDEGAPVSVVLEDAKYELLKKITEKSQLAGYVRREQDKLIEHIATAKVVKMQPVRPSIVKEA